MQIGYRKSRIVVKLVLQFHSGSVNVGRRNKRQLRWNSFYSRPPWHQWLMVQMQLLYNHWRNRTERIRPLLALMLI